MEFTSLIVANMLNPIALRMAKTLWSFGHSEYSRVNAYEFTGIIRNSNCIYRSSWQAYECREDLNYEMLVIESMDPDTETRRISPVAVLGDGYIDLINGPQDHGWCSGYTCRKRLSTFLALVATGEIYKTVLQIRRGYWNKFSDN